MSPLKWSGEIIRVTWIKSGRTINTSGVATKKMQTYFRNNPIETASDLQFMPEVPFRYYMLGFRDYVMGPRSDRSWTSDAASCFLRLVLHKLEQQPKHIIPIMPDLLPALHYVAQNQASFEASENIYGKFPEMLARIQTLYADTAVSRRKRI
ncbi:MAG: hypothetical protein DMG83_14480 [Acidobacteria bacterium]|nr:MAG: hypothetical protein DMG83_14480 [Acidobacteriota bacterium]